MTADRVRFPLAAAEIRQLRTLVEEFVGLLRQPDGAPARPPAPSAYPDDPEADAAFRWATADDLRRRREQDAERVLADLATAGGSVRTGPGRDARMLTVDPDGAASWMRTLTALRLALAARTDGRDEPHPDDAPRLVYEWLGYRLDTLVRAVDGA